MGSTIKSGYKEGFRWTLNGDTLTITGKGEMPDPWNPWTEHHVWDIRKIIIEKGVTSIGDFAFLNCFHVISVVIPNGVENIGMCAFEGCSDLTSIVIPNSVKKIENSAFADCSALASVTLPDHTYIGYNAFKGCDALSRGSIDDIEDDFYDDELNSQKNIPNSQSIDEDSALAKWKKLQNSRNLSSPFLIIPDDITEISKKYFVDNKNLRSVEIHKNVVYISDDAFNNCNNLTKIDVVDNNTVYSSEKGILFNKLKTILMRFPEDKMGYCSIPSSVTRIGKYAFNNCTKLISVTIPDSVTSIGDIAFSGCNRLSKITIPNSVTNIGKDVFKECANIDKIVVLCENPPEINDDHFEINKGQCILHVPVGCVEKYSKAKGWKTFKRIVDGIEASCVVKSSEVEHPQNQQTKIKEEKKSTLSSKKIAPKSVNETKSVKVKKNEVTQEFGEISKEFKTMKKEMTQELNNITQEFKDTKEQIKKAFRGFWK